MNAFDAWLDGLARSVSASATALMATEFLTWPPRFRRAAELYPFDGSPARAQSTYADCGVLKDEFLLDFLNRHRDWSREDASAALSSLLSNCRCLTDWFHVIVRTHGISLRFDADEFYIAIKQSKGWFAITELVDPEAVVSFLMAQHGSARCAAYDRQPAPVTLISDRLIGGLIKEGITDYHVHLGGVRNAQALWRQVLSDSQYLRTVRKFAPRELAKVPRRERIAREDERNDIQQLTTVLNESNSEIGRYWEKLPEAATEAERIRAELRRERHLLSSVWSALLENRGAHRYPTGSNAVLEHQLDSYIFCKSDFLRWHRQPAQTNPGLGAFRGYFRSTDPVWPSGKLAPARFERSQRLLRRSYSEFAAYIAQSTALRRIELRMGPLDSARDYHRFFTMWSAVEKELQLEQRDLQIGFAIHFKRSMDGEKSSKLSAAERIRRFLRILDRDSAVLHSYLTSDSQTLRRFSGRIVRVDFAGAERDVPPVHASFCMNLVRGEEAALETLRVMDLDEKQHRYWLLHQARGKAGPSMVRPTLGQSCHAGEDFAHPLEGLYAISAAVEHLKMREGDTIGHGLALARDPFQFDRLRTPTTWTVRGNQFDALRWLWREVRHHGIECASSYFSELEQVILSEARLLYPDLAAELRTVDDLEQLDALRATGIPCAEPEAGSIAARARWMELKADACAEARAQAFPVLPIVLKSATIIQVLQKRWLNLLVERGIVLEFNPSSNLRVGGVTAASDVPFIIILETLKERVLATINTDNPGVFGSRIENEYALVMQLLEEAEVPYWERLGLLERLRDVGQRFVYWPAGAANGPPADGGIG